LIKNKLISNEWADLWRNEIGVNVIPATNRHDNPELCKKPFWTDDDNKQHWVTWKKSGYQDNPISQEQHDEWKKKNAFKDGMAVICGQVFHNESKKGLWLGGIDCDNLLGLNEVCVDSIERVAKDTLVEQHSNKEKCHIYFYSKEPIQSQALLAGGNIPQIEIKSGGKFLMYCAGGMHKDGSLIDILDCREPQLVEKKQLEKKLDDVFTKYDLKYLEEKSTKFNSKAIHQIDSAKKLGKGSNRGKYILSYLDSKLLKNPELDRNDLIYFAKKYEREHCTEKYDDTKIESLVDQAIKYCKDKSIMPQEITKSEEIESIDESVRIEREKLETPLQQITRYANTVIKEDPKLVDQLIRVCLSTYTDNPINIALLAPSSDGKTYATVKITDLFPKEDVIAVGGMSPTALIHQTGYLIDKDGNPLQEKLNSIDEQIKEAKDKNEKEALKEQKKNLLNGARNCVDLKNKIILFLDNPNSATYEMLKPIMSHDKKEIIYNTTKGDGSLTVKETVIRNWAVFIFCSAKNEARNEVWQEIKTRVLMTSPNSSVKKYKEAIRYNMLKRGLPSWASSVYHNNEDEKWTKFYIADYKKKLNKLFHDDNPIVNVFYSKLTEIFPSSQGDNMRDADRLLSFIELETILNADYRPVYELEFDDKVNSAIITTIYDIDKACKVLGDIGDLPPEKMKFYDDVFCSLVERKRLSDSEILGEVGLTSSELVEEYTRVTGKTTNTKKILENYLQPLVDAGVLDSFVDKDKRNQNKYCKVSVITTQNISNLKSKIIEDSKSLELSVKSCLSSLVKSSIKDEKYNVKIKYNNCTITIKKLIQVISDNSSKSKET
jgi:hypothetical protein